MMLIKFSAKLVVFLLATVLVLLSFAGCSSALATVHGDSSDSDTFTEELSIDLELSAESLSEYQIIFPERGSDTLLSAIFQFRRDLNTVLDAQIGLLEDWVKKPAELPESAKEIVIGTTNRPGTAEISQELRENDFAVICKNDRIFIIGGSDSKTIEAMEYFIATYVDAGQKLLKINNRLKYLDLYNYPIKSVFINGVDIRDYSVIIPESADLSTKYAAENLSDFFETNAGFELTILSDETAETEYEILIGGTNRAASTVSINAVAANSEYIFYKNGNKIVCQGESYMVGGGVGDLVGRISLDGANSEVSIDDLPTEATVKIFTLKEAKSAILMIGDGMGFNTIEMSLPQIGTFVANGLPNKGKVYTGSVNTQSNSSTPTDSAAGGTALASGVKTRNGYVGIDKNNNELLNLRELAHSKGAHTGVISTDEITGATPSAFLAHHDDRDDTTELQAQIDALIAAGEIDWISGGDGTNDKWFNSELIDDTTTALRKLSIGGEPFFLMIEEAHIDKRSHNKDKSGCINMVERFNDTIAYIIQFVLCHPDTALIITADHETGGITKKTDGTFAYTRDSHSTVNVPVFAFGYGTEIFNGVTIDNTDIPKFLAKIYGENIFGK